MPTRRVDLYGSVHKALRSRLFDLAVELDRCDFTRPPEVAIALAAFRRTVGFITEHHHHEDEFVEPALRQLAPELHLAVASHHASSEAALGALCDLETAAERALQADIRAAGARLSADYQRFLVDYLRHMNYEETEVNAALWRAFSDAELAAIRGRLQASIPPA